MVVLATLLALGASLAWWASSTLADADTFATTATAALAEDDVNELLAERLVDRFASDTVLGTSGKPVAVELTRGVVRSDAFAGVFHAAVRTTHEQLVSDRDDSVAVALAGAAPLVDPAVEPTDPADEPVSSAVVAVVNSPVLVRIAHVLSFMDLVAWLCAGGWLLVSGVALVGAGDRRRMLRRLAGGLVVVGVVVVAGVLTVRAVVGYGDPADVHAAAATLVAVFTDSLLRLAKVLVALGAIVGICALTTPPTIGQTSRAVAGRAQSAWRHPLVRAAAPVLALLAGAALLLEPQATVAALVHVTGLALVVGATVALVGGLVRVLDRGRPVADQPRAVRSLGATALTAVVAGALVALLVAGAATSGSDEAELPSADPDGAGCNGFVGLCDLRLDEVALAGAHNAMSSSAEPGWLLADQRLPISGQLALGVRAMMLDVYPGYVSDGRVRTDLRAPATAEAAAADLDEEGRAALKDLGLTIGAIPPEGATIEAYLCHSHCELGASKMVDKLRDVGDFLAHNPNEVLILILQDYLLGRADPSGVRGGRADVAGVAVELERALADPSSDDPRAPQHRGAQREPRWRGALDAGRLRRDRGDALRIRVPGGLHLRAQSWGNGQAAVPGEPLDGRGGQQADRGREARQHPGLPHRTARGVPARTRSSAGHPRGRLRGRG